MLNKLIKRINNANEDDIYAIRQYIDVIYSYKDMSKKDYNYLRQLINDKLEPMLRNNDKCY